MRTLRMFLVALCGVAMLTGTSSCKKENVGNVVPGEEMHIRASVGGTGGNAKTHLVQEGNQFAVFQIKTDFSRVKAGQV